MRVVTLFTAGHGYLNFMGNEFGHPEWIDFPREGNNWSYHYARRQWSLRDNPDLKYKLLANFDKAIIRLARENKIIEKYSPCLLNIDEENKIIAFGRGDFFFFINFHPVKSVVDYKIEVFNGKYSLIINSDEKRFGGFDLVKDNQTYFAIAEKRNNVLRYCISLYIPARCALILKRLKN